MLVKGSPGIDKDIISWVGVLGFATDIFGFKYIVMTVMMKTRFLQRIRRVPDLSTSVLILDQIT